MVKANRTACPYPGCKFKCASKYHHRARYAHISASWKKKVEKLDKDKEHTGRLTWEQLKQLRVLYTLPLEEKVE